MPLCNGQGADGDHCCYLGSEVCEFLVENAGGRRYACGLMLKYGDWDAVVASEEYRPVGEHWEAHPNPDVPYNYCQTFDPAFCCRPELRLGRHNPSCRPGCDQREGDC